MVATTDSPFDVVGYLRSLHSGTYRVEPLQGGRVNDTVRVVVERVADDPLSDASSRENAWWSLRTFILKHAPPWLRYPGPGMPFSPTRLTMEARALHLLTGHSCADIPIGLPQSMLRLLRDHPRIVVPKPLAYDADSHVLLQSDLGRLISLQDWLFAGDLPSYSDVTRAGEDLGSFLGTLHAITWNLPAQVSLSLRNLFSNSDVDKVLFDMTVEPLSRTLQVCGVLDSGGIGAKLCQTWKSFDVNKSTLPSDRVALCHGDMWHTNVFLIMGKDGPPRTAVVDWEFACMGRPGLDLARISAYLFLFSQSPRLRSEAKAALNIFTTSLVRGFLSAFPQLKLSFGKKSFATLYGLHLCNGAFWLPTLWCECRRRDPCIHTRNWVRHGAEWIRYGLNLRPDVDDLLPAGYPLRLLFKK